VSAAGITQYHAVVRLVSRHTLAGVSVAIVAIAIAIVASRPRDETVVADLTEPFDVARKLPVPEVFTLTEVSIDHTPVRAVVARGETRLMIHATRHERGAALRVTFGMSPEVWGAPGDGVRFSIGISDGVAFREQHVRHLDPFGSPADRRWHEAVVSLREYAGLTIDVILNTRAGPASDVRNDVAVWARPVIVTW